MIQSVIPEELRIGITNRCNLRCKHCYVHDKEDKEGQVGIDQYISLLEDMKGHLKTVSITGGDPLMVKENLFSICEKCREFGIKVRLVTNGTLLTDKIIKKLKDLDIDTIQIGVDSINTNFHASI